MSVLWRIWNVVRRQRLGEELRNELETHLALVEEEERALGLSADEARRRARARFGNPLSCRERARDAVTSSTKRSPNEYFQIRIPSASV